MATETPLTVTLRARNGNRAEFVAVGEVDASTHEQLRSALLSAVEDGAKDLVVEFGDVTFLDSSGLRGMIESIRHGATVTLRHPRPAVQQVFDIVEIPGISIEP